MSKEDYPPVSPVSAGFGCRCPRCGKGRLFDGYLSVNEQCPICGLDMRAQDSADGPAVFITLILGFFVVGMALIVEMAFSPPRWVHFLLWPPVIIVGALWMLRPFKALMIALQYRHRRSEHDTI